MLQERLDGGAEVLKVRGLLDVRGRAQLEAARAFPLFRRTTEDHNGGRLIAGELANLRQQQGAIQVWQFEVEQNERRRLR